MCILIFCIPDIWLNNENIYVTAFETGKWGFKHSLGLNRVSEPFTRFEPDTVRQFKYFKHKIRYSFNLYNVHRHFPEL